MAQKNKLSREISAIVKKEQEEDVIITWNDIKDQAKSVREGLLNTVATVAALIGMEDVKKGLEDKPIAATLIKGLSKDIESASKKLDDILKKIPEGDHSKPIIDEMELMSYWNLGAKIGEIYDMYINNITTNVVQLHAMAREIIESIANEAKEDIKNKDSKEVASEDTTHEAEEGK